MQTALSSRQIIADRRTPLRVSFLNYCEKFCNIFHVSEGRNPAEQSKQQRGTSSCLMKIVHLSPAGSFALSLCDPLGGRKRRDSWLVFIKNNNSEASGQCNQIRVSCVRKGRERKKKSEKKAEFPAGNFQLFTIYFFH
jgi:hypothetical protein